MLPSLYIHRLRPRSISLPAWFLLSCMLSFTLPARACGPEPGGPPSPCSGAVAGVGGSGGPDAGAGNPINVITGNKYQREEDLPALPGVLGVEIVRHYNSAYSKPGSPNGPMGREWKLSYETELIDKDGRIQILQADGARVIFDRDRRHPGLCSTALPAHGRLTLAPQANGASDYTWTLPDGRRLHFNTFGKLDSITAATGEMLRLLYDDNHLLVQVTDPQGRSLHLRYLAPTSAGARAGTQFRGVQHIDSPVGRFSYDYGGAPPPGALSFERRILLANLLRVHLPAGDKAQPAVSRRYHHEDPRLPWLLTGISIETGSAGGPPVATRYATFGYDSNGRANLSTHAGNVGKVTLDTSEGGKTVLTNSLGQRTVYRHAIVGGQQRLLEVRGAGCASCGESNVRYAYDKLGQLLETTRLDDKGEPVSANWRELDPLGRTVRAGSVTYQHGKRGAAQWRLRLEYAGDDPAPTLIARPSVVPGKERQTRIDYNAMGQVLRVTQTGWVPGHDGQQATAAIARTTSYQYAIIAGHSLLTRTDGPLPNGKTGTPLDSDVTVFEYGQPADKSNAGKLARYDEHGTNDVPLTAIIAPGNLKRAFTYDGAGRIATISDALGQITQYAYTPRGQLMRQTRDGATYAARYDGLGNPLEIAYSDQAGQQSLARLGYDAAGRRIWNASHLGIVTRHRYDTENRLLDTTTQSSTIKQTLGYRYDPLGHLLAMTDANGARSTIRWNARGLPDTVADALGRVTRLRHDAMGNIVGVTQWANTPEALGQNTETRFERDIDGQPIAVTAPNGATTRYLRDDFGQVIATISPDSGMTRRQFDAAGRLIAGTDAMGNQASYAYDGAGRIVRQVITDVGTPAGQRQTVTTWRYAGAHLVAIDHPQQSERYSHDAHGRLSVKTVIITLHGGRQASYHTRYRYDSLGQLSGISLPDGSMLESRRNGQQQVVALERQRVHSPWLRWLLPGTSIVKDLERDVMGLKRYTYGNGIEALYQRSKEGALARIVYRNARGDQSGQQAVLALQAVLGIGQAVAAPESALPAENAQHAAQAGALGLPPDPAALLDHRYLWDVQGNLLYTRDRDAASSYAYDAHDRLIAAATASLAPSTAASFDRYHYDSGGNRLISQEEIASQDELRRNTVRASDTKDARYDAAGQPQRIGQRRYAWDALGRLLAVHQGLDLLARYRYNHRGLRMAKEVRGMRTYYLYDDDRKLLAEVDADGKVSRQYIYLAGQPLALIDTAADAAAELREQRGPLAQAMADISAIWQAWFSHGESIAFLHNNHLGAPELATDAHGKPVWQAAYAPFGKLRKTNTQYAFQLKLRLPGQYADQETGLYYNDQRYYDPAQGRYLTPDPLGLRAGANSYAYVAGNPLKYVDPNGLILFAFDGTGNSEHPKPDSSISNVLKFYEVYDQIKNGKAFYITGIGTTNPDMPYAGSAITGEGFDQRVSLGLTFLNDYIKESANTGLLDIDVVGFSRGAAEARFFLNVVADNLKKNDGAYVTDGKSRCLNLRFEGLWDTVPHLGILHEGEKQYFFSVPAAVKYAVHAVALNEHRGGPPDFDLRSIMDTPGQTNSSTRIEKAFIGSHSDIGGGFGTGDLSDVALMWMVEQAKGQGIAIDNDTLKSQGWNMVTNPILHDRSGNRFHADDITITRYVGYENGKEVSQTDAVFDGVRTSDTNDFINFFPDAYKCGTMANPDIGLVDMNKYKLWLASYGLSMTSSPIVNSSCKAPS
ncbi:putative deoxyribonuclease RhsA [Janthinobacterium sp. HH107]|nr:putative deoxyribonuclease RhsA [Janthinobacterium sp. HH107]